MKKTKLLKSIKIEFKNAIRNLLNTSSFISSENDREIVDSLNEKGYYILEGVFSKKWCEEAILEIDLLIKKYNDQIWKDDANSDFRLYGADKISPIISEYYKNSQLLSLLQTYEGKEVKDGFTLGARLEAIKGNKGSGGGWHRDHPNVKQSKAIVYLTDVNEENGPFQFIEGSHTSRSVYRDSYIYKYDQFQMRFDDEDLDRLIIKEPNRLKTFTAKAGTVILTDTRGIHRGKPIESGVRYAMTNYLWMHSKIPSVMTPFLIK
jgi:hypothetical protein